MSKAYDYEERSFKFATRLILFTKQISYSIPNKVLIQQVIRSSTSIGANYREGNEAISDKDRLYRYFIVKKEAKETIYWLNLLEATNNFGKHKDFNSLLDEATQLLKIISTIYTKLTQKT